MNIDFKEKFLKYRKTTILIVLIVLAIGLSLLIMNVLAGTPPSACIIGTDVQCMQCETCINITASPSSIPVGESSTLTLYLVSRKNGVSEPSWTADCSINNGVLSNTTLSNGTYKYSVSPSGTTIYTASCTGIGQNPPTTVNSVTITTTPSQDYYRIDPSQTITIYKYGICKVVSNNSGSPPTFIPVKTPVEWLEFRTHYPSHIILADCVAPPDPPPPGPPPACPAP